MVRTGLGAVLAKAPNLQVVGSFSIDTLLARIEDLQPDVVLLDLESAADESLPLEIKDAPLSLAIVVLTDNTEVSWSVAFGRARNTAA